MTGNYEGLSDYTEVKDRIPLFYERWPGGALQSEIVELTDVRVTVKAWAYRTPDDPHPGIGHSYVNIPGATRFTRGSEIENAETSAWGRALAAIGIATGKGVASKDEIASKEGEWERSDPRADQRRQIAPMQPRNPVAGSVDAPDGLAAERDALLAWAYEEHGLSVPQVAEILNGITPEQFNRMTHDGIERARTKIILTLTGSGNQEEPQ